MKNTSLTHLRVNEAMALFILEIMSMLLYSKEETCYPMSDVRNTRNGYLLIVLNTYHVSCTCHVSKKIKDNTSFDLIKSSGPNY